MTNKTLFAIAIFTLFSINIFPQKFDAEIMTYSTLIEADKNKLIETDTISIQINNRTGDDYTEISIPFSKSEKVSNLCAWIEDKSNHRVRSLKDDEIVEKSAFSDIYLYADYLKKCFQLKHNTYPYKITYTYRRTMRNYLTIADWSPVVFPKIPTRRAKLTVKIPTGFQYKKYSQNVASQKIDSTSKTTTIVWESTYDKPITKESFSQPQPHEPLVLITPLNFCYGISGCSQNWQTYGNWQNRLNEGLDELPDQERNTIQQLINGTTDKRLIVNKLYHYLQDNTRYINVSIGIGGLKPYPASYVAQNKYGDCKALTNYMKALLKCAGIESFYTEVYADEQPREIINDMAGPQFNHAILAVPMGRDTIWLETTSNISPFGYLGTFTQNRNALVVNKDNSKIIRLPALNKEDVKTWSKLEFNFKNEGNAELALHAQLRGKSFELFNELHAEYNTDEKDRILRQYLPLDNDDVTQWNLSRPHRDSAKIDLTATISIYKCMKPLGNDYYFNIYPSAIPSFTNAENRQSAVVLPYPIHNTDTLIYHLPTEYRLNTKPDITSISSEFGQYKLTLLTENNKLIVYKEFILNPGTYPLERYDEFYNFIHKIKDTDAKTIILKSAN